MTAILPLLDEARRDRVTPCAAALRWRPGEELERWVSGRLTYEEDAPALREDHLFDLASLTKPLLTAALAAALVDAGELGLEDRVEALLPALRGAPAGLRVRHLLTHQGGLPAEPPGPRAAPEGGVSAEMRERERTRLLGLSAADGGRWGGCGGEVVYSDLGFLWLGELLAARCGCELLEAARERVFAPLAVTGLGVEPLDPERCVPTERRPSGAVVWGRAHDEQAARLGGLAGHAGLFGTIEAVARLAAGWVRPLGWLRPETQALFWAETTPGRALGWQVSEHRGWRGHTGFTGGALWMHRSGELRVLLTNRTWPRRGSAEGIAALRRRVFAELGRG